MNAFRKCRHWYRHGATIPDDMQCCCIRVLDREEVEESAKRLSEMEAGVDAVRGRYQAARTQCGGGAELSAEREVARLQAEHSQVRCARGKCTRAHAASSGILKNHVV